MTRPCSDLRCPQVRIVNHTHLPPPTITQPSGEGELIDAHPWREYNQHGNTCHHPDCTLTEDEHATFAGPQRQRPTGNTETPPSAPCLTVDLRASMICT